MSARLTALRALPRVSVRASVPRLALCRATPSLSVASPRYRTVSVPAGIRTLSDVTDGGQGGGYGSDETLPDIHHDSVWPSDRTMFMSNLDWSLTNEEIRAELEQLGTIVTLSRINRGACRIVWESHEEMANAIGKIDGAFWRGRRTLARVSRPAISRANEVVPTRTLFIGNIPSNVTDTELSEVLGKVPSIPFLRLLRDNQTGAFRGFGYADFLEVEDAIKAKEHLHGQSIRGNMLRVNFARTTEASMERIRRKMELMGMEAPDTFEAKPAPAPPSAESGPSFADTPRVGETQDRVMQDDKY